MGFPEGWVTDLGVSRTAALRLLGNAVVPQVSELLGRMILGGPVSAAPDGYRLMPTPTVGDSKSARNSTAKRNKVPPTGVHDGDTLTDAVTKLGPLLPTPTAVYGGGVG